MHMGLVGGALALLTATTPGIQRPTWHAPARADTAADSVPPLLLTRRQAIDSALAHNPQLVVAREQLDQARARVTEATAIPDPTLSATLQGQTGAFTYGNASEHDYALGLTVPFPDRLRLQGKVATADVHTAEFAYEQLRQQLASQTSQTYDSLLVALRHLDDFTRSRQLAQDFLTRTQARFDAGTAARLDVVKAKVDLAQAQNQVISGGRDVSNAQASLNRLIGRVLGAPIMPADTLVIPDTLPALTDLEQRAEQARPELHSVAAQRAGASAATTLAKEFWLPDIAFSVSHNKIIGTPTTYETTFGIGFPIFFWQHTGGEVAEAQHHERELEATNRDLLAQVHQEVRIAYAGAVTALQQAVWIRDQLLPEAEQAYRIASTSYGLGGSSALDVLDAERDLLDAHTQYTDALGAVNDAVAQLELAVGAPLGETPAGDHHD